MWVLALQVQLQQGWEWEQRQALGLRQRGQAWRQQRAWRQRAWRRSYCGSGVSSWLIRDCERVPQATSLHALARLRGGHMAAPPLPQRRHCTQHREQTYVLSAIYVWMCELRNQECAHHTAKRRHAANGRLKRPKPRAILL